MMISALPPQPSIASLTARVSFFAEGKQQWAAETSDALEPIQALQDYASVLRSTVSQVDDTVQALQQEYIHRMKALFDEPVIQLRREIKATRDEYERMLREDIVPKTNVNLPRSVVYQRVAPLCVLFETYAAVNGERMRTSPDVMEGIIPMVGRQKSGVFYREISYDEYCAKSNEFFCRHGRSCPMAIFLPRTFISDEDLSEILRQHNWYVLPEVLHSNFRSLYTLYPLRGIVHFYDDASDERCFFFHREGSNRYISVSANPAQMSLVRSIVEDVEGDIKRRARAKLPPNPFARTTASSS